MKCFKCEGEARYHISYMRKSLCRKCFILFYEKKVRNTFLKYGMHKIAKRIGVAVSGGKDSLALLKSLYNLFSQLDITAIYINLGITSYSNESEKVTKRLCGELGVDLIVYNLSEEEGFVIPDFKHTRMGSRMCGVCGTVKRYILNRIAVENGIDTIATGHNLDDTVEVLFELYLRGSLEEAARIRPVSVSNHPKMANRIKPLIELTDEEDLYYVDATNTEYVSSWCPLVRGSRMVARKELLRKIEREIPNYRHLLLKSHIKRILPKLDKVIQPPKLRDCMECGMPSVGEVCSYCKLMRRVKIHA